MARNIKLSSNNENSIQTVYEVASKTFPIMEEKTIINQFLKRLSNLDCPYLNNTDQWYLKELLFTKGLKHMQLLTWLLSKLDENHVDKYSKIMCSIKSESQLELRLLKIFVSLGISMPEDKHVQRDASVEKQAAFLDQLLKLIETRKKLQQDESLEQSKLYNMLVSTITKEADLPSLWKEPKNFIPKNVQKEIDDTYVMPENSTKLLEPENRIIEQEAKLECVMKLLGNSKIEEYEACNMKHKHSPSTNDNVNLESYISSLQETSKELDSSYNYMKEHFQKSARVGSTLGPAFSQAGITVQLFKQILDSFESINSSQICQENVAEDCMKMIDENLPSIFTVPNLKEYCSILHNQPNH